MLDSVENLDKTLRLVEGVSFGSDLPPGARFRMSARHQKDTGLTDDLANGNRIKVCSRRLVDFLRARKLKNVEYLPVTILDHRGKEASRDHFVVHPVVLQDALDLQASKPRYNRIPKTKIDKVERLVIDEKRLDPGVRIFRLAGLTSPVLVERALAAAMEAEGFVGPVFGKLDSLE